MHPNEKLLHDFYAALAARDGAAMSRCYHAEARFSDPAFPDLRDGDPGKMWRMLTSRAGDMTVVASGISADDRTGRAHWEANYTFSGTGRRVLNIIDSSFEFRDGLIYRQTDRFDFWRWSRQALGPIGLLLGWSPFLRAKVQGQAGGRLKAFEG